MRPVTDAVLERAAHQPGRGDRPPVVGERRRAGVGELSHLGQLLPAEPLRDRRHEAGGDERLPPRRLDQRAEHRRRVDDRIGVRHRQDRAVAAGCRRSRAGGDRLLVLAARASAGGHAGRRTRVRARARWPRRAAIEEMTPSVTVTATQSPPASRPSSTRLSERPLRQKSVLMRPPPARARGCPRPGGRGAPPSAPRARSAPARGSASRASRRRGRRSRRRG